MNRSTEIMILVKLDGKAYSANIGPVSSMDRKMVRLALLVLARRAMHLVIADGRAANADTVSKLDACFPRAEEIADMIDAKMKG